MEPVNGPRAQSSDRGIKPLTRLRVYNKIEDRAAHDLVRRLSERVGLLAVRVVAHGVPPIEGWIVPRWVVSGSGRTLDMTDSLPEIGSAH
jgi:hypothetical protein